MDYSTKISERLWNQPDKGERESKREETFIDDIVQKHHIETELLSGLGGIHTVFDAGAGCGRFSILLAKQGLEVTHFDISQPMIDKAKELAKHAGVANNIHFIKGTLEDLSAFSNHSFDMVISFDAPISYTYPHQESVIENLVSLARKRVMFSVSSRFGSLPYLTNPLNKNQFILDEQCDDPWVQWCIQNKENAINDFAFNKSGCEYTLSHGLMSDPENEILQFERGEAPWVITYLFTPNELESILKKCGVKDIKMAGPGAYARTIPRKILVKIMNDPEQKTDFLDFCHVFDSNPYVCGMGKDNLFAKGNLESEEIK